jgi:pyridoxine 5-phosphate synthase
MIELGVNIDHVATLRNARGGDDPDPLSAAVAVRQAGAEQLVCHLREDRRHIQDKDLYLLKQWGQLPINLEMALTDEMERIALDVRPALVTLVPERREERTTEGGLRMTQEYSGRVKRFLAACQKHKIRLSLFLAPDLPAIDSAIRLGVDQVELHTGEYSSLFASGLYQEELERLASASDRLARSRIRLAAGHGLNVRNLLPIMRLPKLKEVNIGHSIISRAIFVGLERSVCEIRDILKSRIPGTESTSLL